MAGSQFYNCDFHVHTPASLDYKDKSATPESIVQTAIENGLNAIAITDHNSHESISEIREAAEGTGLVILPGFEVTAQGGHIIAIFEPDTKLEKLDDALTSCGITKDKRGKEDAIGKTFKEILKIIVDDFQGIAIAAHADAPKGFLKTIDQGQLNISIYKDENLLAMEITNLDSLAKYIEGKDPNYDRQMPCIQCSDAHDLAGIGLRSTLLKMDHVSVNGIIQAFNEPTLNIKFPNQWKKQEFAYINNMKVDKGFFADQIIEFNPNFNCLLGGPGSGKSTIIEFLRFVFDQVSDNEDIKKDCFGKLNDLAGAGATIQVRVTSETGEEYLISRTYNQYDNPLTVRTATDTKSLSEVDIKSLFPLHAYSQGEALIISRSHLAQLDLIDKHILPIQDLKREIQKAYSDLNIQTNGLVRLEEIVRDRSSMEKDLATFTAKIVELNKQLHKAKEVQASTVVKSHQHWIEEKNYLSNLVKAIETTKNNIIATFEEMELPLLAIPFPENETPNKELMSQCKDQANELIILSKAAQDLLINGLTNIEKRITEDAKNWKIDYEKHRQEYHSKTMEQGEDKIKDISDQIEAYQNKVFQTKSRINFIRTAEEQLNNLLKKRKEIFEIIRDRKERVITFRKKKIKEIIKTVGNLKITLTPDGYREEYANLLIEVLKGSRTRSIIIEAICNNIHPIELSNLIREGNFSRISQVADIPVDSAQRIVEQTRADITNLYRIEAITVEDLIEISFEVGKNNFRPLDKLSTGQKATVIVSLSLIEGTSPIIFDQPEDALYSPIIFSNIVSLVRQSKENRQFIFATHNPNIAVGSGLDLGIVLESSATRSTIQRAGGMDDDDTKKLVILHLEGGKDAILKRLKAYKL
jgi:ABC-type cobalamin/Fe3+-siderophores transport system ATPase subunit